MKRQLGTIIKLGITAVGLLLVSQTVDLREIVKDISQADLFWVLIAFALVNVSLVVRAYRWRILLLALQAPVRFSRLVALYFAANFFNSVFPSGLTGDVIRAVEVAQDVPNDVAAGTVIVDRATGLMALFMLALVALPFVPAAFPQVMLYQIVFVCVVGLIGGFAVLEGSVVRWFDRFVPGKLRPLWAKLELVLTAVSACGWRAVWAAMAVSIVFNLMQIGWWWAAGMALGYSIPISYYFLTTPLMSLAILLPSIGGLGIREWLALALFVPAGLSAEASAALSLLVFAIERISGFLGAPIYIYSIIQQNRIKSQAHTSSVESVELSE